MKPHHAFATAALINILNTNAFSIISPIDSSSSASASGLDAAQLLILSDRLDLSTDQIAHVQTRLQSSLSKKKALSDIDIGANLSWINCRLALLDTDGADNANSAKQQLVAIALGHPPVLGYDIEKNLEPTIAFYEDALLQAERGNYNNNDGTNNTLDANITARLASFLCESPELLEYNVKKRLMPRLKRVHAAAVMDRIDEHVLRIIATKTDSRFDEWLSDHYTVGIGDGSSDADATGNYQNENNAKQRSRNIQHDKDDHGDIPSSYIVLSNLQSGGNIGNILRSASIFGCKECIVVGQRRYRLTGDHGSRFDLPRHHVYSHDEAKSYLQSKGVCIYGVEIMEGASPIMRYDPDSGRMHFPFHRQYGPQGGGGGAAFVMGNEGQGLSTKQKEICDEFIFIPQTRGGSVSGGGSASLNVACAATVILQAYCVWAGYPDADRDGEKFVASSGKNE